ncbi:hypothetical protein [Lentibacillus juripiscarius]|uniref:hypothetical protein n=1 Tax=Lentibacillus juripiscarius TaxID=257446 RepID=UPI0036D32F2A
MIEQKRKRPFSDVWTGLSRSRLDELDLSPIVAKVKVNLMLGERKGNTMNVSEPLLTYRTEVKEVH